MEPGIIDPYRDTIIKLAVKQVLGALATRLPFIASGPIGWFASVVLSKLVAILLDKSILGLNLYLIEIQTNANVNELKELLAKAQQASGEEREKLEDQIIDSTSNLIRLNDKRRL